MMVDYTQPICAVNDVTGKRVNVALDPDEPQPDREGEYCLHNDSWRVIDRYFFRADGSSLPRSNWRIENREPVEPPRPDLTKATDEELAAEVARRKAPPEPDYEAMRSIVQKYYDSRGAGVKCRTPMDAMDKGNARAFLAIRDDLNAFVEAQSEPELQEWGPDHPSYPNCPVPEGTDTEITFRNGYRGRDCGPEDCR